MSCTCYFCNKTDLEVTTIISGPDPELGICDECIQSCFEMVVDVRRKKAGDDE